jgi:hypothetical protein
VLDHQHNPQYLESEDRDATLLVGDSDNDRLVEYERRGDGWVRTWNVGREESDLEWPRDADRLPNGNTLVVDSLNHRVLEVTPDGEVVWEFYPPWLPYDAERIHLGDEPGGPAMSDLGATGSKVLTNGQPRTVDELDDCAAALSAAAGEDATTTDSGAEDGRTTDAGTANGDGRIAVDGRTNVGTGSTDDGGPSAPGQPGFGGLAALAAVAVAVVLVLQRS